MDDLIEEMEADFESNFASPLDNSSLATVSKLARAIAAKEKEITSLDEQLKTAKKKC